VSDNGQQAPPKEKPWQELEEDARQADATGIGLKVTWEGTTYQFHFGELSAFDAAELRRQTGLTTSMLYLQAADSVDIDTVAAIIWLSRRLAGDTVSYAQVASAVKWQARMTVELADPVPVAPAPVTGETGEAEHPQA
jgi:hypothetical protein